MHILRQHYVVIIDLRGTLVEVGSLVDAALPTTDEYPFCMKETGFPDHSVVYRVQALTPRELRNPLPSLERLDESWQTPSQFRRDCIARKAADESIKNRPLTRPLSTPSPTYKFSSLDVSEVTVQTALHLHLLLDGLPSCLGGETLLTILWPTFDEGDPILPEEHVELFGALKRAREWFDARLFFRVNLRDSDHAVAEQLWNAFLDTTPLRSANFRKEQIFDPNFVWSGSIGESKSRYCLRRLRMGDPFAENTAGPRNGGVNGNSNDVNVEATVRLLSGHSLMLKEYVYMRKLPMHLIDSEPQFYLTVDTLVSDERSDSQVIEKLFSASDAPFSKSFVAILTLEFAIDSKPAPSSKENGAGRRPWDKMAASSSGTSAIDEEAQLSPADFILSKPRVTRELKHCGERRSIDFVAFPPKGNDAAFIQICKLRDETELNSQIFETKTSDHDVEIDFLRAFDHLPVLRSTASFVQCIEKFHLDEGNFESYLNTLEKYAEPKDKPNCSPTPPTSSEEVGHSFPEDILSRPTNDYEILGRGLDAKAESDKQQLDASEIEAEHATGSLLSNMKALTKSGHDDDPFCSKTRVEDMLAVCRPRLDSLAKELEEKRQRPSSFDGAVIASIPWPDVKEIQWHGVYYNRGFESEEKAQEIHVLKSRCQPMETSVTTSRAAAKTICNVGSLQSAVVDHFDAFCSGRKAGGEKDSEGRKSSIKKTPTKRKTSSFKTPTKSSLSTGKKTPMKKDAFSPAARKILAKAKGVLTSPRKISAASRRASASGESQSNSARKSEPGDRLQLKSSKSRTSSSVKEHSKTTDASQVSSQATDTLKDKEKESRSERNKAKLKEVCLLTLKERGVKRTDAIFSNCFNRLYTVSKSFVKDLKTSQNLREAMKKIVESNVDLIVSFEKGRV